MSSTNTPTQTIARSSGLARGFFENAGGSVAFEIALLLPLFMLILWFISAAAYTWRLEGAVHRATAAVADVLVNQRRAESETTEERISRGAEVAGEMFVQMVSGEEYVTGTFRSRMQYGLKISYYNTVSGTTSEYASGSMQCTDTMDSIEQLGSPGSANSLVTDDNMGQLELVKVVGCITHTGMILEKWVFPNTFTSAFVATRRE